MKRKILMTLLSCTIAATPVMARPVLADSPYEWIQEGDNVYCYVGGEYDEDHLLTGWHQIGGETYYFETTDFSDERPIGRMAQNEWLDLNDARYHFDAYGRLDEWVVGLE